MRRLNARVILASERPEVRYYLRELVETGNRAVVVGQAENAPKALALARNLRPDVIIIDCYLPHTIGLDAIPLSRIGGLDTAQTISSEIPNTGVILLNCPERNLELPAAASLSREVMGNTVPCTFQELWHETEASGELIFATVDTKLGAALGQKVTDLGDKAVFFGGIGIMGGLALMLTIIFAGAGAFVAAAGGATLLLGLAGKLLGRFWRGAKANGKVELG